MGEMYQKAVGFLIIIGFGYLLKRVKFLSQEDSKLLSKLLVNLTAPAAIIANFAAIRLDGSYLLLVLLGLGCNLVLIGAGWLFSLKKPMGLRALWMLTMPSFNIGSFAMPYAQNFFGPFRGGVRQRV